MPNKDDVYIINEPLGEIEAGTSMKLQQKNLTGPVHIPLDICTILSGFRLKSLLIFLTIQKSIDVYYIYSRLLRAAAVGSIIRKFLRKNSMYVALPSAV
jgi:hypothetical protein